MGLGPLASWANVVTDKWIFKHKLKANGFWTGTRIVGFYGTVVDPAHPQLVCWLNKSLYGLTQVP
jgi:hypothetical protein